MRRMFLFAIIFLASTAHAGTPPLFRVTHPDRPGELLLAGTVHFLPDRATATPETFEKAYANADRLVFELDFSKDMAAMGREMVPLAQDEVDGSLNALADERRMAELEEAAGRIGLPLRQLAAYEPWFVVLQLNALLMHRLGFDSASGVETIYASRALRDGKPVAGLETISEQVGYFDAIPGERQLVLLEEFLSGTDEIQRDMDKLLAAWKNGDDAALDRLLQESWQESTELAEALLYQRNRDWQEKLEPWLERDGITLVMVGAGHLVGEKSVPKLLEKAGYDVERVEK